MEKAGSGGGRKLVLVNSAILLLGTVAFSCCVAAEFKKSKASRDMKLDGSGSLCALPRSPAFALALTALLCLTIAQIVGTSAVGIRCCSRGKKSSGRSQLVSVSLLILSWVSFGLAAVLLGTASSMNNKQAYGRGWLDGDCYVVRDGVYVGSAVLAVSTVVLILGFIHHAKRAAGRPQGPQQPHITHS